MISLKKVSNAESFSFEGEELLAKIVCPCNFAIFIKAKDVLFLYEGFKCSSCDKVLFLKLHLEVYETE